MRQKNQEYYIRLNGYAFTHDCTDEGGPYGTASRHYIPRPQVESEIEAHLFSESASRSGTLLVAGHRGVGKTTLIKRVVERQRQNDRRVHLIELNLAQDDMDERMILRLFAIEVYKRLASTQKWDLFHWGNVALRCLLVVVPVAMLIWLIDLPALNAKTGVLHSLLQLDKPTTRTRVLVRLADQLFIPFVVGAVTFWSLRALFWKYATGWMEMSVERLLERAEGLITRMQGETTTEKSGGLSVLKEYNPFHFTVRRQLFQASAKPKEIELELAAILDTWARLDPDCHVLFLIDELDKLVPNADPGLAGLDDEDLTDETASSRRDVGRYANDQLRERQRSLATLFANLKHFLHSAKAKFIFIGGTELYDTVMADTSNRDAYLSSIFDHVVYLPSFFKFHHVDEHSTKTSGLATTVERFLSEAITGELQSSMTCLHKGRNFCENARVERWKASPKGVLGGPPPDLSISDAELDRTYACLQHLAVYLLFRSNGIPRKAIQVFERYVVRLHVCDVQRLIQAEGNVFHDSKGQLGTGLYLHLDGAALYAHALLAHMNRPLLSARTKYHRELNDKLLVSLTYILDHLHKFHSSSFSTNHLELAPETIALNKVPEFRDFLDDVMSGLTGQYIRHVNNGLYEYQFYKKTHHEISILSKISDLDAAAMNFTLDESLPVKQHFNKRMAYMERRAESKSGHLAVLGTWPHSHSGEALGDLHFFDEEYEEALEKYRIAIISYERAGAVHSPTDAWDNPIQFHNLVRLTLKEAHCLEKMRGAVDAAILIGALTNRITHFLGKHGRMDLEAHWRMLLLTMAYRTALNEKSARGSLTYQDVKHAEVFLGQLKSRFPYGPFYARTRSTLLAYIGSVLHYSGHRLKVIPQKQRGIKGTSALSYYGNSLRAIRSRKKGSVLFSRTADFPLEDWVSGACGVAQGQATVVANLLSKYADALLLEKNLPDPSTKPIRYAPFLYYGHDVSSIVQDRHIGAVAYYMLLSARSFVEAVNLYEAVNQVKELFYFAVHKAKKTGLTSVQLKAFGELRDWCIRGVHRYNLHLDRVQRRKYKALSIAHPTSQVDITGEVTSYQSEILEVEFAHALLRLTVEKSAALPAVKALLTQYESTVMLSFARCRYLILCMKANWLELDPLLRTSLRVGSHAKWPLSIGAWHVSVFFPENDALADLIADSLHCGIQLSSMADLYGTNYMVNHTLRAWVAESQGDWSFLLSNYSDGFRKKVRDRIGMYFDKTVAIRLDAVQFYATALEEYKQAVQTHHRGKPYKRIMAQMFMLEDDYMANMYHFCCALERLALQDAKDYKNKLNELRTRIDLLAPHLIL